MSFDIQKLLTVANGGKASFPQNSRYYEFATNTLKNQNNETIVYLKRRFIPSPDQFSLLQTHSVTQGDRLDNVSNQYLGDPELYWRICDANGAIRPNDLTETIGTKLRITLPQGIPGGNNA